MLIVEVEVEVEVENVLYCIYYKETQKQPM